MDRKDGDAFLFYAGLPEIDLKKGKHMQAVCTLLVSIDVCNPAFTMILVSSDFKKKTFIATLLGAARVAKSLMVNMLLRYSLPEIL